MGTPDLNDRLARLMFLCSEISKFSGRSYVPSGELEELLKQSEALCRAIRRQLRQRP